MRRIVDKRKFALTWSSEVSPKVMAKLNKNKEKLYKWFMEFNGDIGFEVTHMYNSTLRHIEHLKIALALIVNRI